MKVLLASASNPHHTSARSVNQVTRSPSTEIGNFRSAARRWVQLLSNCCASRSC